LVGRETELAYLHERLEKALRGERQIVFISGEPGIGKTALADTFVSLARERFSVWIAHGQCIEHYGAGEAYLPLLTAFRRLGQEPGKKRLITHLRRYAPTWLAQLPALVDMSEREQVQREAQGATQERMLREFTEMVEVLTSRQGLILVLEDLHWSDASTLDWLSEEGIVQMRQGFAALQSTGAQMPLTGLARELAWAYQKAARPEEGLPLLAEALAVIPNTGERFAEAELYRLKGELLLRKGERENGGMGEQISHSSTSPFTHSSPEACFQQALGIARQQQAKSLELRTVICLSRLWQSQGKTRQAHQHLARIYHWFTEGLDTADLQEAKALLKELA
jgi:tetratricopeptide (TPR) repeat protein